jgi:hypothetical protein
MMRGTGLDATGVVMSNHMSKKRIDAFAAFNTEATISLSGTLLSMLKTYQSDSRMIIPLLRLVRLCNLEYLGLGKQKGGASNSNNVKQLVQLLKVVYLQHGHDDINSVAQTSGNKKSEAPKEGHGSVLSDCAMTLAYVATPNHKSSKEALEIVRELSGELMRTLAELINGGNDMDDDEHAVALVTCLRRVRVLYEQVNVTELRFSSECEHLLKQQLMMGDEMNDDDDMPITRPSAAVISSLLSIAGIEFSYLLTSIVKSSMAASVRSANSNKKKAAAEDKAHFQLLREFEQKYLTMVEQLHYILRIGKIGSDNDEEPKRGNKKEKNNSRHFPVAFAFRQLCELFYLTSRMNFYTKYAAYTQKSSDGDLSEKEMQQLADDLADAKARDEVMSANMAPSAETRLTVINAFLTLMDSSEVDQLIALRSAC